MKLTEMFNPLEQRRIAKIILNSSLTKEQVFSVLESAAELDKQGIDPVAFFKAVNVIYEQFLDQKN